MGLTPSAWCYALGLTLWLVGERVLGTTAFRTPVGGISALAFLLGLYFDLRQLDRASAPRTGLWLRATSGALIAASAALYAGVGFLAGAEPSPLLAFGFVVPLCWGLPARLAAERAYRSGPLDMVRLASRTQRGLTFGVVLSLVFAVNYLAKTHDVRRDLSYRAVSEPSAQVRELVSALKQPVRILLLFERGNEVVPAIEPYFQALSRVSPRIGFEMADAARYPDLLRKHKVRGNGYALLLTGEGPTERAESFLVGDDLRDARRVLKTLDAHMANHLSALVRPLRRVYIVSGHGERSVAGDVEESRGRYLRDFEQLLARFNLRTQRLGMAEGLARSVPADAAAVLLLGPERPLLEAEVLSLVRYVKGGGRLWLGLEPGVETGLSALFDAVGVAPVGAPVACETSYVVRSRTAADHVLIETDAYASHPVTKLLRKKPQRPHTVMVRATGLALNAEASGTKRVTAIHSQADCFVDTDGDLVSGAHEAKRPIPLLVALTLAAPLPNPTGVEGRVVIAGDGDLATDQVLRNEGNTFLTLDIMRWLLGDESMQAVATLPDDLPVLHQRAEDRAFFYLSAFFVPLPLFIVALWTFRRQRARPRAG